MTCHLCISNNKLSGLLFQAEYKVTEVSCSYNIQFSSKLIKCRCYSCYAAYQCPSFLVSGVTALKKIQKSNGLASQNQLERAICMHATVSTQINTSSCLWVSFSVCSLAKKEIRLILNFQAIFLKISLLSDYPPYMPTLCQRRISSATTLTEQCKMPWLWQGPYQSHKLGHGKFM